MDNLTTGISIIIGLFLGGFSTAAGQWFFNEHGKHHVEKIVNTVKEQHGQFKNKMNGGGLL